VAGALLGGALADAFGFTAAIQAVAFLTVFSGVVAGALLPREKGGDEAEVLAA
jgi:predicted MFS family arabinose efflux permease